MKIIIMFQVYTSTWSVVIADLVNSNLFIAFSYVVDLLNHSKDKTRSRFSNACQYKKRETNYKVPLILCLISAN